MSNYNRVSAINSDGFKSTLNYGNPQQQKHFVQMEEI